MLNSENTTAEFIRICAQSYWALRNYSHDLESENHIQHAAFVESKYGPKKEEFADAPVGFSWEIEVLYKDENKEIYTFEITYDGQWVVMAEHSNINEQGSEKLTSILDYKTDSTEECISLIIKSLPQFIAHCDKQKSLHAQDRLEQGRKSVWGL